MCGGSKNVVLRDTHVDMFGGLCFVHNHVVWSGKEKNDA